MEPYTGRTAPPKRHWPMNVAVLSLVFFSIVLPVIAGFLVFRGTLSFSDPAPDADGYTRAYEAAIVGLISGALGVLGGLIAAIGGKGAGVRIVAILAILVGLVTGGVHALIVFSVVRATVSAEAPPAPAAPSCGPDSRPVIFGGDSRYTPCPEDDAAGQELLDLAVPQLPTHDVTVASVDAVGSTIRPDVYDHTIGFDNGDIVVAWFAAPVTCASALWRDGAWQPEVTGTIADGGGCIYTAG